MRGKDVVSTLLGGGARGIGGTVYGTVLALAAIVAGAAEHGGPRELLVLVATTATVIWLAHVYAHGLGESIEQGHRLTWREFTSIAARERSILLAAAGPTAALLLGAVGLMRESRAVWLALGVGLFALAVQGARYAHVEHLGPFRTLAVVSSNLALGLVVVALKVLVSH
jgi:hypothetical protein